MSAFPIDTTNDTRSLGEKPVVLPDDEPKDLQAERKAELEEKMQKLLETQDPGKEEEYDRVLAEYNRVLAGVYTDYTEEPAVNEEPPVNHVVEEEEEEEEELPGALCAGASDPATVIIYTMAGGGAHWENYEVHYDDDGQQAEVYINNINGHHYQWNQVLFYYEDLPDQFRLEDKDFDEDKWIQLEHYA